MSHKMSLDGGYIGSIDHAISNLRVGQIQGRAQGHQEGVDEGYNWGYHNGWTDAVAIGNANIEKQMEYTRQHIAEKETLAVKLAEQKKLIELLVAKVDQLEQENATLRDDNKKARMSDGGLRDLVDAMKKANHRLQEQVAELDAKFAKQSKEYGEQLWQFNRCVVFMNTVRGVIEDLTKDDSPQSERIRDLFKEKYAENVDSGIQLGAIKNAPEQDEEFSKRLPKTHRFIVDILNSVGRTSDNSFSSSMDDSYFP